MKMYQVGLKTHWERDYDIVGQKTHADRDYDILGEGDYVQPKHKSLAEELFPVLALTIGIPVVAWWSSK